MQKLKIFHERDFPPHLPKLNQLYDDLFSRGKGFRAQLIQKLAGPLSLEDKQVHLLCQTIEFIHNASLLHDDLIDRSVLRRSKPAAWVKYTPEYAVLAGDYLLARVMVNLSQYGNLQLIQYTAHIISDLLEGEWIQDSLVQDWDIHLQQLDEVHKLKTASLFKWCIRAPFICKEDYRKDLHEVLEELGALLGLLFQRGDDLLDFNVRNYEGKAVLGDLKSGYLNSFGVFLCADLSAEQKEKLKKCQTMEKLYQVVGREYFDQKLKEFDQKNEDCIALYNHYLKLLDGLLPLKYKGVSSVLKDLPQILYWRKV